MSTFRSSISVCGLSSSEAAAFLDVSPDTVKSWCSGRSNPPLAAWLMLGSLFEEMLEAIYEARRRFSLEGIHPRSYNTIEVDLRGFELPAKGSEQAAAAMTFLMAIKHPS